MIFNMCYIKYGQCWLSVKVFKGICVQNSLWLGILGKYGTIFSKLRQILSLISSLLAFVCSTSNKKRAA